MPEIPASNVSAVRVLLYGDVNLGWWAPNIMLMIVPCVVCGTLLREDPHR